MVISVTGRVGRVVQSVASRRRFAVIALRIAPKVDRFVSRLTGGRYVVSQLFVPMIMLTTTGAKSGLPRESPLASLVDGDAFYVVGSNFGTEKHPAWSGNLLKNPRATVAYRGRRVEVVARLLSAEEKAEVWPRLLTVWPSYDSYVERSGRDIRVFRLEPVGQSSA